MLERQRRIGSENQWPTSRNKTNDKDFFKEVLVFGMKALL